jgi:hypothetical protein
MILFGTCEKFFQKFKKKSPKIEETKCVPYDSMVFPPNSKYKFQNKILMMHLVKPKPTCNNKSFI